MFLSLRKQWISPPLRASLNVYRGRVPVPDGWLLAILLVPAGCGMMEMNPAPDGWLLAILLVPAGCGMIEMNPALDGWMWANRLTFVGKIMQDMLEVIA